MANDFRQMPSGMKPSESIDFKVINNPLEEIYRSTVSNLEKFSSATLTSFLIISILKSSYMTYKAIRKLVADTESEKYSIQAHILSRSIIDAMFVVSALLDNPDNVRKYEKAGYREYWEKLQQEKEKYGNDPDFVVYLQEKDALLFQLQETMKLTPEEKADPHKRIPYWPIPGQLVRKGAKFVTSSERLLFLQEIYKWHYGDPSGISHLDWGGMAMSVFATMPQYHWDPGKFESDAAYTGILFLLIMLSEIEVSYNYGLKNDLKYIWTILGEYYLEVKEYYKMRYASLL